MLSSFIRLVRAALPIAGALWLPSALGADWPTRPITLIVPFAPGGTTDIIARELSDKLGARLGQSVVVDNRAGAGGTLGATLAAKAAPDGYTLFLATIAHTIAPGIYKSLAYDFQRDLDPVALVASTPNVLIVNPELPVKSVGELIAYAKANPGKLNFGSAGIGSTEHLSGELFRAMTNTQLTHVPYKGGAPMMAALIGGQIEMAIETSPSAAPHVRSGKVRALAVTTATRSSAYPGVPTLAEAGLPGYEVTTWFALMVPHGTPSAVVQRLDDELGRILADPEMARKFAEQGVTAGRMGPAELAGFIRSETAKWTRTAKEAGISAE
jgi:tripartite-type tricarboxylate transporter receptor subunit TctC